MPKWFRNILIGLLICVAIGFGFYISLWVMLIGGIVQIVEAVKDNPVNDLNILIGVARIVCAGFSGWLTFFVISLITWLFAKITK